MTVLNADVSSSINAVNGPSYNTTYTCICSCGTDSDIGACILKVAAVNYSCNTAGIDITGNNGRNASVFAYYRD